MSRYNKYHIKEKDRFDINDFPKVEVELDDMLKAAEEMPAIHKDQILISYFQGHLLEKDWTDSNPELTRLVKSGQLITTHIEALFESCKENKYFLLGFEDCIREYLAKHKVAN